MCRSVKEVLRILCTKDLEMSVTDPLTKGISFTEARNINKKPPKILLMMSLGGGMHSHIKDFTLAANKQTPCPEPHLQTQLPTMKPRTDMTKLLMQKEKQVPQFLLNHVVILISSIFPSNYSLRIMMLKKTASKRPPGIVLSCLG